MSRSLRTPSVVLITLVLLAGAGCRSNAASRLRTVAFNVFSRNLFRQLTAQQVPDAGTQVAADEGGHELLVG